MMTTRYAPAPCTTRSRVTARVIVGGGEGATYGCDQTNEAVKSEFLGDIVYKLGRGADEGSPSAEKS
jgi:hypothetical protein